MPKTSDDVNQHGSAINTATIHTIVGSASRRGESLAARIEEGAARLLAFKAVLKVFGALRQGHGTAQFGT